MTTSQYGGPVDYFVFAFPQDAPIEEGVGLLLQAVRTGTLEVLDLELVSRDEDGLGVRHALGSITDEHGFDLTMFEGAESGILDQDDLNAIAYSLEPGWKAIALVYEERSLAGVADAWERAGGRLLLSGGVDMDELDEALTRTSGEVDAGTEGSNS